MLHELSHVELLTYIELVSRCDNWKRRNIAPPWIRAVRIAEAIGKSKRRVQLAIDELLRRRLVVKLGDGKAQDPRGCQVEISTPDILDPSCDPYGSQYGGVLRSATIAARVGAAIRTDHSSADRTLLVSRSIDPCQPRSRAGARGAGGRVVKFCPENNFDDLEQAIVVLFEPRWRRLGAKLIRKKLAEVRDLAAPELVESFCKSQLKKPHVQSGRFPPSLALCREDFVTWLEARERAERNAASTSAPAAPRKETPRATAETRAGAAQVLAAMKPPR